MEELKPRRTYSPCDECPYGIDMRDGSGSDAMCKICEFKTLLDRHAAPENKPLTLEQLRQMDEQPVWVVMIGEAKPPICEIVVECYKDGIKMASAEYTDDYGAFDLYGKTWLAYARRPENTT